MLSKNLVSRVFLGFYTMTPLHRDQTEIVHFTTTETKNEISKKWSRDKHLIPKQALIGLHLLIHQQSILHKSY